MRLNEVQIMNSVHPTDNQKRVLAKIAASPTSTVAAEEISTGQNMVAARDMLMKLGLITLNNGEAAMTERGAQVAVDENLIDDNGQLTKTGQAYAYTGSNGQVDADMAGQAQDNQNDLSNVDIPPIDPAQAAPSRSPESGYGESFSLLKELIK